MQTKSILKYILLAALFSCSAQAQVQKSTLNAAALSSFPDNNSGQITPAIIRSYFNSIIASFQQYAGLNKQVLTTYTIATSDYGQLVTFSNSSPIAVIIPQAIGSFSTFNTYLQNIGTGAVTITPTTSTICGSSTLTLTANQSVWVISDGTNYQCAFGLAGIQISYPLSIANGGTNAGTASGTSLDNITGFSSLGFLTRTGAGTYAFQSATNGILIGNLFQAPANTILCNPTGGLANWQSCTGGQLSANMCLPIRHVFTTGTNATFTTDTCNSIAATYLEIEMVGGGGGGAGSGTSPGAAGSGTASCWNTSGTACSTPVFLANGGANGSTSTNTFSAGGSTSGCDFGISGGSGGSAVASPTTFAGGAGGNSFFGGGGAAGPPSANPGNAAQATSGSGGGGAASGGTANSGGGGAAGGYCRTHINTPAGTYVYSVGALGSGGTLGGSGAAGGNGAGGQLIVTSKWQ